MKKFFATITLAAFLFLSGCVLTPKPIGMDSCDRVSAPTKRAPQGECIPHPCEVTVLTDKDGTVRQWKNIGEFKHPVKPLWFILYDNNGDDAGDVGIAYDILPDGKWKLVKSMDLYTAVYIAVKLQMYYHPTKEIVTFCPESKKKNLERNDEIDRQNELKKRRERGI